MTKVILTLMTSLLMSAAHAESSPKERALIAFMKVRPGTESQFLNYAKEVIEESRREAGNIRYQLHQSVKSPQQFAFYELFESHEALELHRGAPYLKAFLERTKPITVEFTLEEYVPKGGLQ